MPHPSLFMRILLGRTLRLALLVLGAAPSSIAAQARLPALRMGEVINGVFTASDPVLTEWGSYKAYRFEALPNRVYRFAADLAERQAELRIAKLSGVLTDYLAVSNSSDSVLLRFRPPTPGAYLVVLTAEEPGAFTLQADEISTDPPSPRLLVLGQMVEGALTEQSGVLPNESSFFYDLYSVSALQGQEFALFAFGASATLGRMEGRTFVEVSGGDTGRVRNVVRVPEDGEYMVRVSAPLVGNAQTPYTLRVVDTTTPPEPRRLQIGREASGYFDVATAHPAGGELANEWVVSGSPGQQLTITVRSDTFDTYLTVGRLREDGFEELDNNDDFGANEGTNSRVTLTLPTAEDYLIRIRPFRTFERVQGPYTVHVTEGTLPTRPSPRARGLALSGSGRMRVETRPVRWGVFLNGILNEGDATVEDGSPYDAWVFSARAGERITITLRSTTFDAYLAVGINRRGQFMELSSNDDIVGEDGSDARVVMFAPENGDYAIRVNTFRGEAGPYTLLVERSR